MPDTLVRHDHAALGQDQLDVSQTETEYVIQPDCVADDVGRETMPSIGGGCCVIRSASPDSLRGTSPG